MTEKRYQFGVFEADTATGELRRQGMRVRLHPQPFQILCMMLARPGELLTREQICQELWPDGTFVDYEHGVNSAMNRIREALGDKAGSPRFVETLARRGYRFLATVTVAGDEVASPVEEVEVRNGLLDRVLAAPEDLPKSSHAVVRNLFVMLQLLYVGFYVGALANLAEIEELMSPLPHAGFCFDVMAVTAAVMIPVRVYLVCAAMFQPPQITERFRVLWPLLLVMDLLWALSPFLLLHHINYGVAIACVAPLVYAPFAQRSLVLMGAFRKE